METGRSPKVTLDTEGVRLARHHEKRESNTDPGGSWTLVGTRTSTCSVRSNSRMLIRIGSDVRNELLCR